MDLVLGARGCHWWVLSREGYDQLRAEAPGSAWGVDWQKQDGKQGAISEADPVAGTGTGTGRLDETWAGE